MINFHFLSEKGKQLLQSASNRLSEGFKGIARTQVLAALSLTLIGGVLALTVTGMKNDVYISDGERVTAFSTLENGTERLLAHAGVNVQSDDELVRNDTAGGHISIEVLRAFNVSVVADGKKTTLKMTGGNVGDALKKVGVQTTESDQINSSVDKDLTKDMEIVVQKVMGKMKVSTKTIPFSIQKKYTNKLYIGKTKVERKGKDGMQTVVTEQGIINGNVVSSKVVSTTVTKAPVDQILLVGTKSLPAAKKTAPKKPADDSSKKAPKTDEKPASGKTFKDSKGKTVSYRKLLTGKGTAYTAPKGAKTSTGRKAQYGVVAVNPKIIPYGTKLYICSADGKFVYGYAVAGDTGGALRSGRALVDLFYNTRSQCLRFGRRNVKVYVL